MSNKKSEVKKIKKNLSQIIIQAINLFKEGDFVQAYPLLKTALSVDEKNLELQHIAGVAALNLNMNSEAVFHFTNAIRLKEDVKFYRLLSKALKNGGQVINAIRVLAEAADKWADNVELWLDLGKLFREEGKVAEAMDAYQNAMKIADKNPDVDYEVGKLFVDCCKKDSAKKAFEAAILTDNSHYKSIFARLTSALPLIAENQEELETARQEYKEMLVNTARFVNLDINKDKLEEMAFAVASTYPYFLAPYEESNKELQKKWGEMVSKIMKSAYPEFSSKPEKRKIENGDKIKVGFVCSFVRNHSVWKIPLKGWLEQIDKTKFETYLYFTGEKVDEITQQAAKVVDNFVSGFSNVGGLAKRIKNDTPDILIYPEIGMDGITFILSCLRLSPVQCVSLGHPETTGLDTIDYYLSSDLMEPYNAEEHYTEELIKLPNLAVYYEKPIKNTENIMRSEMGVGEKDVVYISCQTICKYLPKYDYIFPAIAKNVSNAKFVFVGNQNQILNAILQKRLALAFAKEDLNFADYCVMLPKMPLSKFDAMLANGDVYLDNLGWSGNNTTSEALGHYIPVVTRAGDIMRCRHSYGIMKMIEVEDTIAKDENDYVNIAVKLGKDKKFRDDIKNKIKVNISKLYEDKDAIKGLEDFIISKVKGF